MWMIYLQIKFAIIVFSVVQYIFFTYTQSKALIHLRVLSALFISIIFHVPKVYKTIVVEKYILIVQ